MASCSDKSINPCAMFRFDVRQINDAATFRVGKHKETHWIIAACNDGYLKVIQPFHGGQLIKAIKGLSGNPVCLEISGLGFLPKLNE
jgi:hypothetical protein